MKIFYKTLLAILFLSLSAGNTVAQEKVSASFEANVKQLARWVKPDIDFEKDKKFFEGFVKVYQKYFSEKEVGEIVQFYKTPIGQKFLQVGPDLTMDLMQLSFTKGDHKLEEKACWDGVEGIVKETPTPLYAAANKRVLPIIRRVENLSKSSFMCII